MISDIAVITQFVGNEYCDEIVSGIRDFLKDKPVRLSILEVRIPEAYASDFEYQYWAASSLIQSRNFSAAIIISGTFCSEMPPEQIKKLLSPYLHCPIISVSVPLPIEDSYYTKADCETGIKEIITHMIKEHGKKKIGMITAGMTDSQEGIDRFNAYKKAMEENGCPIDEKWIIDSNFSQNGTIHRMKERIKTKEDVTFDALFCANDFSAFGAFQFIQEIGLRVPEDVAIIGYDNCSMASELLVPLTTIDQQVTFQGYEAARAAYEIISGKNYDREIHIPSKPVYRTSCGCRNYYPDYNSKNSIQSHSNDIKYYLNSNLHNEHFQSLLDKIQSSHTLVETYALIHRIFYEVDINAFAICLYKTPVLLGKGEAFALPYEAEVTMAFSNDPYVFHSNTSFSFNPHDSILPEGILDEHQYQFVVNSIFFGEKQYGYMLYTPGNRALNFYAVYMKIVANEIARAYEYTKDLETHIKLEQENKLLLQDNSLLSQASKTDEMTGVYNRRGFLFMGQQSINMSLQMESNGAVIFGDMDGLKKINDNFGHDAGDKAIKAEAEILSSVFRSNDVIGRLGGDEFAIVCPGMKTKALSRIKDEIQKKCDLWNKENSVDYKLSISLGCVEFDKDNYILQDLLTAADHDQYIEKRARHAKQ